MSQFHASPGHQLPFPAFLALGAPEPMECAQASEPVVDDALSIALAVADLERPGDAGAQLSHLQGNLVALLCGQERQPGLEAAADDLYRAATCFLQAQAGSLAPPSARHLRLLHNAADRFQSRLAARHSA
jgi:hypothetical protein